MKRGMLNSNACKKNYIMCTDRKTHAFSTSSKQLLCMLDQGNRIQYTVLTITRQVYSITLDILMQQDSEAHCGTLENTQDIHFSTSNNQWIFLIQFQYVSFHPNRGKTAFFTVNVHESRIELILSSLLPLLFLPHP